MREFEYGHGTSQVVIRRVAHAVADLQLHVDVNHGSHHAVVHTLTVWHVTHGVVFLSCHHALARSQVHARSNRGTACREHCRSHVAVASRGDMANEVGSGNLVKDALCLHHLSEAVGSTFDTIQDGCIASTRRQVQLSPQSEVAVAVAALDNLAARDAAHAVVGKVAGTCGSVGTSVAATCRIHEVERTHLQIHRRPPDALQVVSQTNPAVLHRRVGIFVTSLLRRVERRHILVRVASTAGLDLLLEEIGRCGILSVYRCRIDRMRTRTLIVCQLGIYRIVRHDGKRLDALCLLGTHVVLQQSERQHVVLRVVEGLLAVAVEDRHITVQQHVAVVAVDGHLGTLHVSSQTTATALVRQHTILVERTDF